MKADLYHLETY